MGIMEYGRKIETQTNRLKDSSKICQENKETILKFDRHLRLNDYSGARRYKYLNKLTKIGEENDIIFEDAEKEDIEDVVLWLKERDDICKTTRIDYKKILKRFYRWIGGGGEHPECVKWMNTTLKKTEKVLPKDILTEDDIKELLQSTTNARDRAFIAVLWETGARIGELIDLKISDLNDHKHGFQIVIYGKTGSRRLPLIMSVPHIQSWLTSHPRRKEKEAPLWVNIGTTNQGKKTGYRSLYKAIKKSAKNAGIEKPVNPHHFRHSRATYMASRFTEAQLCEWFGWVQGSDVPAQYVHMSGRDIDASYARLYGIEEDDEKEESTLAPKDCPRCGNSVPPDAKFCYKCGMALSLEAAREIEEDEQESAEKYSEVVKKDPDALEDMQDFMEMLRLIRSDDELMDDLNNLVREKRRS